MIDAERMLGTLVRNAMSGGGRRGRKRKKRSSMLSGSMKGALGMGALGVAIAAFEHFSKQQPGSGAAFSGGQQPVPAPPSGAIPPPPPSAAGSAPPPPPPPPPGATAAEQESESVLLIRAMIAAANADHEVDEAEKAAISRALEEAGLGEEEKRFIAAELEAPLRLGDLAAQVASSQLAEQVYLASYVAIEVDTQAERNYLARLAQKLDLSPQRVKELESMLTDEAPPAG